MRARDYLIGLVLGGMFIMAFSSMIGDLGSDYGVNVTEFNSTYDKMEEITNTTQDISDDLANETIDITSFWGLALAPFRALKLVLSSAGLLKDMVFAFGNDYGIPDFFLYGIGTIIVILISFVIISVIFKRST